MRQGSPFYKREISFGARRRRRRGVAVGCDRRPSRSSKSRGGRRRREAEGVPADAERRARADDASARRAGRRRAGRSRARAQLPRKKTVARTSRVAAEHDSALGRSTTSRGDVRPADEPSTTSRSRSRRAPPTTHVHARRAASRTADRERRSTSHGRGARSRGRGSSRHERRAARPTTSRGRARRDDRACRHEVPPRSSTEKSRHRRRRRAGERSRRATVASARAAEGAEAKRPRRQGRKIVGLKIGASQLAAAVVTETEAGHELVELARRPLEPGIVVDGEVRDAEALAHALKAFFDEQKLPKTDVRIGLSSNRIGVRTFDIAGDRGRGRFDNAVRFKAHEVLPVALHRVGARLSRARGARRRDGRVDSPHPARRRTARPGRAVRRGRERAGLKLAGDRSRGARPAARVRRAAPGVATPPTTRRRSSSRSGTRRRRCSSPAAAPASSRASSTGAGRAPGGDRAGARRPPGRGRDDPPAPLADRAQAASRARRGSPRGARGGPAAADTVRSRARQLAPVLPDPARVARNRRDRDHRRHVAARRPRRGAPPDDRCQRHASAIRSQRVAARHGVDPGFEASIGSLAVPIGLAIDDDPMRSVNLMPRERHRRRAAARPKLTRRSSLSRRCPARRARVPLLPGARQGRRSPGAARAVAVELAALPQPTGAADRHRARGDAGRAGHGCRAGARRPGSPGTACFATSSRVLPENVWLTSSRRRCRPRRDDPRRRSSRPAAARRARSAGCSHPTGVTIDGHTYSQPDVARLLARLARFPSLTNVQLQSTTSPDRRAQDRRPIHDPRRPARDRRCA